MSDQVAGGSVLPQGFLSYAHSDDKGLDGAITWLKNELETAYNLLTGRTFTIFQDRNDIEFGQNWAECLDDALEHSGFLIPILTPSYFTSEYCRTEAKKFMASEKKAGRNDLILPIYLIEAEVLERPELFPANDLVTHLLKRHRSDWRDPGMQWQTNAGIRKKINSLALQIDKAVQRAAARPKESAPKPDEELPAKIPPAKRPPAEEEPGVPAGKVVSDPSNDRIPAECADPVPKSASTPRPRLTRLVIGGTLAAAVSLGVWGWTTHLAPLDMVLTRLSSANTDLGLIKERLSLAEAELAATAAFIREPGATLRDCLDCPKMAIIPAGDFIMGSEAGKGERDEQPAHAVTIAKNFAIGMYEVTFAEWDACVAERGCDHRPDDGDWSRGNPGLRAKLPVINVNWYDAQNYVTWLREKTGLRYRLPSEAEWEYAARGGATTRYFWGDQALGCDFANGADMTYKRVSDVSSQDVAKCDDGFVYGAPVGSFKPNLYGIHDTAGNVSEWVEDHKSDSYQGTPLDGSVHLDPGEDYNHRVIRGGDWSKRPGSLRPANRLQSERSSRENVNGFRVVRDLPE